MINFFCSILWFRTHDKLQVTWCDEQTMHNISVRNKLTMIMTIGLYCIQIHNVKHNFIEIFYFNIFLVLLVITN